MTLVEDLKLGVFTSALVSDVDEHSVWTIPALDILVPAVMAAAWSFVEKPPLPSKYSDLVGDYYDGVAVAVQDDVLVLSGLGELMNLTAIEGIDSSLALRATVMNSTDGCRWLDDGTDLEIAYFDWDGDAVSRLRFMQSAFSKLS